MTIVLRDLGSFHMGGTSVRASGLPAERHALTAGGVPALLDPNGTTCVGQCYVQYFLPLERQGSVPLLLWHGGSLTGVTWERTPDERPGWLELFLQHGWDVYNSDAVERGRAGWAPGDARFAAPALLRTGEDAFTQFRLGAAVPDVELSTLQHAAYPGCRFPLEAFGAFMRQVVPRWVETDELVLAAHLATLRRLGRVVIVAHSQGGAFAVRAAEAAAECVAGLVLIEPARGGTAEGCSRLSGIPVLVVYGDHIERDARWPTIRANTTPYLDALRACGGDVELLDLPQHGITGNSHMLMMERNNAEIAGLIQDWLVRKRLHPG